jgi:hypothetical protein
MKRGNNPTKIWYREVKKRWNKRKKKAKGRKNEIFPPIFRLKCHERPKPNLIIICPPVPKFKKADRWTYTYDQPYMCCYAWWQGTCNNWWNCRCIIKVSAREFALIQHCILHYHLITSGPWHCDKIAYNILCISL